MPYANREDQLQARRAWSSAKLRKGSEHRQSYSKYDAIFDRLEHEDWGEWGLVATLKTANSAGVQAWRIKNNFYRDGTWEAKIHGAEIWARRVA